MVLPSLTLDEGGLLLSSRGRRRRSHRRLADGRAISLVLSPGLGLAVDVTGGGSGEVGLLHGGLGLVGRGGGELLLLLGGLGRGGAAAEDALGLCRVVAHVLLGEVGHVGGVLAGGGAELSRLLVDDVRGVLELLVDDLLVHGVDGGHGEGDGGAEDGEGPVGDDLDEEVRDEGNDKGLRELAWTPRGERELGTLTAVVA